MIEPNQTIFGDIRTVLPQLNEGHAPLIRERTRQRGMGI